MEEEFNSQGERARNRKVDSVLNKRSINASESISNKRDIGSPDTFNLSEKIYNYHRLDTEDVKEFIRLLKKKIEFGILSRKVLLEELDKLAGDKLTQKTGEER